ncbi:MAG: MFS transporter [Acidobacteria bacterium]|nr:MFS transporter [Acidobacteriota bacterium]
MPARPIKNLRWTIAALLFLATVINYVDRQALSVLAAQISADLNLSNIDYSNIVQAFLVCYASMYIVWGVLIDRWGTRTALAVSMVWWSLANTLHAGARGAMGLGIFRALLGLGESGNFLAAEKAISEWFPPKERAFANGLVNAAAATGAILAPPLIVWIYTQFGWRMAFVITGCMGFVWLFFWLTWYWIPAAHPRVTVEEREMLAASPGVVRHKKVRWVELFRFKQSWGLFLSRVVADPVWWFYLFWLPKYLQEERGFTITDIGLYVWMPYLTADIGSIVGGYVSGWFIQRGVAVVPARKRVMVVCAALMPLGLIIPWTDSPFVALAVICVITFSHMAWKTNLMTMTNDLYPTSIVGSVAGLVGLGSSLGGIIFTRITGIVVENYSYTLIFIVMAFLHPAALLLVNALIRGPIDDDSAPAVQIEPEARAA